MPSIKEFPNDENDPRIVTFLDVHVSDARDASGRQRFTFDVCSVPGGVSNYYLEQKGHFTGRMVKRLDSDVLADYATKRRRKGRVRLYPRDLFLCLSRSTETPEETLRLLREPGLIA